MYIPFALSALEKERFIWLRYYGDVCRADLRGVFHKLYDKPSWRMHAPIFIDLRDVTTVELGFSEILWLSQAVEERRGRSCNVKRAGVHAPGSVQFGVSRIWQQLADERVDVCVSRDRREALGWLELDHMPSHVLSAEPISPEDHPVFEPPAILQR